jgi:hypothetical protein
MTIVVCSVTSYLLFLIFRMEEYIHFYYIVYSTLLLAQIRRLDFSLVLRGVRIA